MHTSKQLENTVWLQVFNGFRQVCIKNMLFLSFSAGGRLPENWCPNFGVHSAADVCRKKGGSSNCEVSPVRCPRHCLLTLWLPPLTNKSTKSRKHNVFHYFLRQPMKNTMFFIVWCPSFWSACHLAGIPAWRSCGHLPSHSALVLLRP